jgi:hypothetical protein
MTTIVPPGRSSRRSTRATAGDSSSPVTTNAPSVTAPDVAALAGTEWVLERTEQTQTLDHTGLGSQRAGNRYIVHPDDIRRLHQGEAFIIHGGQALKVRVRPPHRDQPPAE